MAVIPDHIIDSVRDAFNIVDVISRYVSLKKSGRNYMGLCPFHKEKTPSFSVHPEKQIYKCFGCGAGGNVFGFLMEYEHITFFDAVKRLAEEAGIELELKEKSPEVESEAERLYEANEIAQNFFSRKLSESNKVLHYLNKRGIKKESIERFKLGLAPDAWDSLVNHIQHFKYSIETFTKLGLILEGEKEKKHYDRFRNRLMFPIHNTSGKVVGFGGRDLSGKVYDSMSRQTRREDTPKYINSPESPIYQKSYILYGLYFAKEAIAKSRIAIFVEGYMDWLQLFQNGIKNVVATSGTSLTEEHARLIRRYSNEICVCYDSDAAGISAAIRGGEILFQNNLEVKVLLLPEGQDPDSYVAENGSEKFLKLVRNSQDYFTFRLNQVENKFDLQKALERSQAVSEILETLAPLRDNIKTNLYIERVAEKWGTPTPLLYNELKKKITAHQRRRRFDDEDVGVEPTVELPLTFIGAWSAEKDILLLLMNYYGDINKFVFKHIEEEDFLNPEFRQVLTIIQENAQRSTKNLHQVVLDKIDNKQLRDLFTKDLFRDFKDPARYLQDCIRKLKIAKYQFYIDVQGKKIKELRPADHLPLLQEIKRYQEELKKWQNVKMR
jgi:DNA primase